MTASSKFRIISDPGERTIYELARFADWGRNENYESRANAHIGPMKSAHLFRGGGLLHHEFALICFGKDGVPDSWMRVERAARQKPSRLAPRMDSIGPLTSTLR